MPPTICLPESPTVGSTVNTRVCRRSRIQNGVNMRWQTLTLEQMLRTGIISETPLSSRTSWSRKSDITNTTPGCFAMDESAQLLTNTDEQSKIIETRKEFMNIIIRTVNLVRRNRILRMRINALQAETRKVLQSTSNNPENQQTRMSQAESDIVSSSTDRTFSTPSSLPDRDSTGNSSDSFHRVSSICDNRDHINENSFLREE